MSRNRITSIIILLILLSVIVIHAAFPDIFTILSSQVQIKSIPKPTDEDNTKNEPSSSLQNSIQPEQTIDIMIDPGHGGTDTGADRGHILESEVTLDISKKLKTYLEEKSYRVEMTRGTDVSLYQLSHISGTIQKRELDARVNIINESRAKIFVSIHVNSYPEHPDISGSIVYYNPTVSQSRQMSDCIQKQLNDISVANSKRDSHNPQEADFYLLKNSNIPGVLVETAFITNSNERKLLTQDAFRSQLAKAVSDGICDFMDK